jgi:hypothetical protein
MSDFGRRTHRPVYGPEPVERFPFRWLGLCAIVFVATLAVGLVAAQWNVPRSPVAMATPPQAAPAIKSGEAAFRH